MEQHHALNVAMVQPPQLGSNTGILPVLSPSLCYPLLLKLTWSFIYAGPFNSPPDCTEVT